MSGAGGAVAGPAGGRTLRRGLAGPSSPDRCDRPRWPLASLPGPSRPHGPTQRENGVFRAAVGGPGDLRPGLSLGWVPREGTGGWEVAGSLWVGEEGHAAVSLCLSGSLLVYG